MATEELPPTFRLGERLGEGGTCEVYEAEDAATGRPLAVKLLRQALAQDPCERRRFLLEATTGAKLSHPNILEVLSTGEWQGRPYLLTPLVDGGTLRQRLDRGLARAEALELLARVADALDHAHARHVLHRDLKPENVLLTRAGQVKVADWGLARATEDPEHLTKTGIILGTPTYMAPEQITAGDLGPAMDLYALGVILFEALAGRPPFASEATGLVLRAHLRDQPPPLAQFVPGIPPGLAQLVATLLAKSPQERPASAALVARELRRLAAGAQASTREVRPPRELTARLSMVVVPRFGRGRSRSVLALAAALLAVGALGTLAWLRLARGPTAADFALSHLRLSDPWTLELRFEGRPAGLLRLAFTPDDGRKSAAGIPPSTTVGLDDARAMGQGRSFAATLRLPQPLLRTVLVQADGPATWSGRLDPRPQLEGLVGPLDQLLRPSPDAAADDDLRSRLKVLDTVRIKYHWGRAGRSDGLTHEQARERVATWCRDTFGCDQRALDRLRTSLPRLTGLTADASLARRLAPLRYVEAVLSDTPELVPPFGPVAGADGVLVRPAGQGPEPAAGWIELASYDHGRAVRGGLPSRALAPGAAWLVSAVRHDRMTTQFTSLLKEGAALNLEGERGKAPDDAIDLGRASTSVKFSLRVEAPRGRPWPPDEAALEFLLINLDRGCELQVLFPPYPALVLLNTSGLASDPMAKTLVAPVLATLRLDPARLPEGDFAGRLTLGSLGFGPALAPIGVIKASLRARWASEAR